MTPPTLFGLFYLFFVIGLFTFGGGIGMIPIIQHEFVDIHHWLSLREVQDAVAVGMVTPGPAAIMATFIGYRILSWGGATAATFGIFTPSIILVYLSSRFYSWLESNRLFQGALTYATAAVIGLMASATYTLTAASVVDYYSLFCFAAVFLVLTRTRVSPFWPILISGLIGVFYY